MYLKLIKMKSNILFLLFSMLSFSCATKNDINIDKASPRYVASEILYEASVEKYQKSEGIDEFFLQINLKIFDKEYLKSPLLKYSTSYEMYAEGFDYYFNIFNEDIFLIYNDETIKPKIYQFEPSQGFLPYEMVIIGFFVPETWELGNCNLKVFDRFINQGVHLLPLNYSIL